MYRAVAHYPVTSEQLDLLLKYGFSKYRFQIVGGVNEGEFSERQQRKLVKRFQEAYEEVRENQAEIATKEDDLSDF